MFLIPSRFTNLPLERFQYILVTVGNGKCEWQSLFSAHKTTKSTAGKVDIAGIKYVTSLGPSATLGNLVSDSLTFGGVCRRVICQLRPILTLAVAKIILRLFKNKALKKKQKSILSDWKLYGFQPGPGSLHLRERGRCSVQRKGEQRFCIKTDTHQTKWSCNTPTRMGYLWND